jgi:Arc/MetJ family transcription regulator
MGRMYLTFMTRTPASIEISELRKRLRIAIDERRKATAARRTALDAAAKAYTELLDMIATPLVQKLANALRAEGHNFTVFTPNGGLRMALAKSADDFIEFALDTSQDEPFVTLQVNRSRGRRVVQHERPVKGRTAVDRLSEEDVLQALLDEIAPYVER